ncbi:MAG: FG-GAP repeat protein [Phycisphaerae bacterium]|nr:FG-GAP repeat protein [Phycisphaerae bacterium]
MPWTVPAADPPLAGMALHPSLNSLVFVDPQLDPCIDTNCVVKNEWYTWAPPPLPLTSVNTAGWQVPLGPVNVVAWTGFLGCLSQETSSGYPASYQRGDVTLPPTSVGARVLGQQVEDRFGFGVASDGNWLYISSPKHTAVTSDVPLLASDRTGAGVVYQLRTNVRTSFNPPSTNLAQLWIEPGVRYPTVDAQIPTRNDYTMPVPHNYIIETVGSWRGNYQADDHPIPERFDGGGCVTREELLRTLPAAEEASGYTPYPTATAGYNVDRTPQIVGPHANAGISFVASLGDVNGDGVRDFAVGSPNINQTVVTPGSPPTVAFTGPVVGSIFIVYGRAQGVEGDYLLENLARDLTDSSRLNGVLLQGASAGEKLARVFDDAGDINGDGYADVIVGNEGANDVNTNGSGTGEAVILLGSSTLLSGAGGWQPSTIPTGEALRFTGADDDDLAGANVAGIGDVDGDGYADFMIAAPGADRDINGDSTDEVDVGVVYLIYGMSDDDIDERTGGTYTFSLTDVGTVALPGAIFIGHVGGDQLGGGQKVITGSEPSAPGNSLTAYSRGVARLGDLNADGIDDFAISAMLADVAGKQDAGEVYVIYGRESEFAPE